MLRHSVADFFLGIARFIRAPRPSRALRRHSIPLGLALVMNLFSLARAGQPASLGCTPLPFLLTRDVNFFPVTQAQQAPSIPLDLHDLQTTVNISAQSQEKVKDTFELHGNVVVTYRQFKLTADNATYDKISGEVVARGHVIFTDHRVHLEADEAHYNIESEKGWFANGHGFFHAALQPRSRAVATENPLYVQARRVDRLDEETYSVHEGRVSSCEDEKKGWSLSTRSARVQVDDKIVTHGTVFRLLDVPVFYSPVLAASISPRRRQTGFLLPHLGNSTQKGYIVSEGFFWAINSSADLLVGIEDYSKRGLARSALFEARPSATSEITVDYFGINDKADAAVGQARAPGNSVRAVGQSSNIGYGFRGVLDVDYIPSLAFRQTWSDNFTQAVTSEVHQTGYLSKNFDAYSVNFYLSRYQNFLCAVGGAESTGVSASFRCPPSVGSGGVTGNSVTIRQAPSISISGLDKQVGRLPFYFAFDVSAAGLGRTEPGFATPNLSERFDFHPELTLRLKPFWGFHFTPSFGVEGTHYGTSLRADHSPINRIMGDFSADLRPPTVERVFDRPLWGYRLKHVLESDIRYSLVRSADKEDIDNIVRYDQLDVLSETNEVEYSLTNTLMVRRDAPPASRDPPQARDFISLRLSQKYYFDPTFGGALEPGRKVVWDPTISLTGFAFAQGRRLSPVVTVLKFAPSSIYDTEVRADFNPNGGGVLNAGITSHVHRGLLGLAFTDFFINRTAALLTPLSPTTSLSQLASFNLLRTVVTYGDVYRKGFSGAFGLDYNFAEGISQQLVSQASYNFGCFGLDVEYRRFNLQTLRQENSYRVAISFSNFGTFGNLKPRERLY